MYKRCVTEQSARRQRELEAGLLKAMCSHRFEDISISELCDQLGVPRKSFYRYFSSKEGALYALIDHTLMDFTGEVFKPDITAAMDTLEHFFIFWRDHRLLLTALERSGLGSMLMARCLHYAMQEDIVTSKIMLLHSGLKKDYVVMFMVTGLISLVLQWHHDDYRDSPRQMAITAAHLMTQPIISVDWPKQS